MSSSRDSDGWSFETVATTVIQGQRLKKKLKNIDDQSPEPYLENDHLGDQASQRHLTFEHNVKDLEGELDSFMAAVRPIGSSSGLIRTAKELKNQNLAALKESSSISTKICDRYKCRNSTSRELLQGPSGPVNLARTYKGLSFILQEFSEGLEDIPEFSDKRLTDILKEFCYQLEDHADKISAHQDPVYLESIAYDLYLSEVTSEMSLYFEKMRKGLAVFVKEGITAIRDAQDRAQNRLQNMSTVATFFSAVTATTLQYSINQEQFLGTVVLALWVSSLILSMASAINLQLAMHWRAAMYRSPRSALPVWASFCLDNTPIACLVAAVLSFAAGLVAWTFSSSLGTLVTISASTLTAITVVIVMTIAIWEVREQVRDYTNAGKTRFSDPVPSTLSRKWRIVKHFPRRGIRSLLRVSYGLVSSLATRWRIKPNTDEEELPKPYSLFNGVRTQSIRQGSQHDPFSGTGTTLQPMDSLGASDSQNTLPEGLFSLPPTPESPTNQELDSPLTITVQEPLSNVPASPLLQTFQDRALELRSDQSLRTVIRWSITTPSSFRLLELKHMRPTCTLNAPAGIKGNLHFSPDGNRLAMSTRDRKVAVWDLKARDPTPVPTTIFAFTGRFAWSRDGSHLVSCVDNGREFRVSNLTNLSSVRLGPARVASHPLGPIAWLQKFDGFAAVADQSIHIYNSEGTLIHQFFNLSRSLLDVRDIAVVPTSEASEDQFGTLILVGRVKSSDADERESPRKRPKDAKFENRVVVYNMHTKMGGIIQPPIEASVLADIQHVTVSQDGQFALLSYSDGTSPELWSLQDPNKNARLEVLQLYVPTTSPSRGFDQQSVISAGVEGKACFGGESDEWVIASNGVNQIYVWETASGGLQETLNPAYYPSGPQGDIATVACAAVKEGRPMLIASTSSKGNILIWESSEGQNEPDVTGRASALFQK
ncbi:hypothetical protein M407DRAFT_25222 [Tulasnella calospora MUT 4182]|uniref:Uncharacterized protein n=1 Tax=Tulasnella calospora MUT 4182 TaxID=1051891 RepID=A0A0C3KVF4_9AGAM|nr:hypothetical protein M407DRAFT_25222 [Tulasnella calospora MUT 4182]